MSGTSLDAVDAAMILTDGQDVLEFGPVAERKYAPEERAVLQAATDAARAWNWQGPRPEGLFRQACEIITKTHSDAWAMMTGQAGAPKPVLAGVHGQTVLHRRTRPGQPGATLQLIDAPAMQAALGVPLAFDFRSADVAAAELGARPAPAVVPAVATPAAKPGPRLPRRPDEPPRRGARRGPESRRRCQHHRAHR